MKNLIDQLAPEDMDVFTQRVNIVSKSSQKNAKTAVATKETITALSNTLTSFQNAFNAIAAHTKNTTRIHQLELRRLEETTKENNMERVASNDLTPRSAGSSDYSVLASIFPPITDLLSKFTKDFEKLNLTSNKEDCACAVPDLVSGVADLSDDVDFDRRKRRKGRSGGFKWAGRALGALGIGLDVADRLSDGEGAGEIAAGVGGGLAGGWAGAQAGAALGAFGGPAGAIAGGLVGSALGYAGGSWLGDEAYEAVNETVKAPVVETPKTTTVQTPSPSAAAAAREAAKTNAALRRSLERPQSAMHARREPTSAPYGYAEKFASWMGDTFKNVSDYVTSLPEKLAQLGGNIMGGIGEITGAGTGSFEQANVGQAKGDWARDTAFITQVNAVAQKYNIDANDLLGLMASESGINPQARNPSGAVGLIQFMPQTASALGVKPADILKMSRAQQMTLVDRYFAMNKLPQGATAGNLYASVFLPAYTNKSPNFVVARRGGPNDAGKNPDGSWYKSNAGLDLNRDGGITISELGARVSQKRVAYGLGPSRTTSGFQAASNLAGNIASKAGGAIRESGAAFVDNIKDVAGNFMDFFTLQPSVDMSGMKAPMVRRLKAMGAEYKQRTGKKLIITSAFRSRAKQEQLYRLYLAGRGNPAAKPGTSKHESGLAIDINPPQADQLERTGLLAKYGLHRPDRRDSERQHIEPVEGRGLPAAPDNPYNPGKPIATAGKGANPVVLGGRNSGRPLPKAGPVGPLSNQVAVQQRVQSGRRQTTIVVAPQGGQVSSRTPAYVAGGGGSIRPRTSSTSPMQQIKAYFGVR